MNTQANEPNLEPQSTESLCQAPPRPSLLKKIKNSLVRWFKQPDITFEDWERIERKYSPHSSHHGQIYFREGGL